MRDRNQVELPINLEIKIEESDPVRKVVEICEKLDYSELESTYLRTWRKVNPRTMFMLLVYGYMNRAYSSREIEHLCKVDIRFMWILNGEPVPDHTTIARFQNEKLTAAIEDLFYQFVQMLIEMGEVTYRNVFVDGTKIEANANKYTFVWAKAVEKNRQKLLHRISQELPEIEKRNGISEEANLVEAINAMLSLKEMYHVEFVRGSGKRKTGLQRDCETLCGYLERLEAYENDLSICGKRKSYSKTDADATFMRMKEDAMRNGQLKPGYNVQIMADSEYIVGMGLFPNPTDTTTLIPFLDRVQEKIGYRIRQVVADAGYASEENFTYLEKSGIEAYIKPNQYEVRKTRKFRKDIFRVENLIYDEANDRYLCPNSKQLNFAYESHHKSENGYPITKKNYVCEDCSGCPYRMKCFKGNYENRKVGVSQTYARQNREATERITTEEGILLRMNRSIQVEGAFGVLKQDFAFRRFLTRGKRKTETQFFLLAFAFNVHKLWNRLNSGRFQTSLFPIKAS